jgi:hypothetical protein
MKQSCVDSVQEVPQPKKKKRNFFDLPLQATVGFLNFVVMISSDVAFVVIVINYNTTIIILAEIALALLKIFWNNYFIWNMMKKLSKWNFLCMKRLRNVEFTGKVRDFDHIRECDIPFIALNIGLNNLIYPVIAIMVVSSNCFYDAIFSAPPITTSYTAPISAYSTTVSAITIESSYDPPFSYSYQCSSVIYAYYCPVFIFMLAFEAVLIPVLLLWYRIMISTNNNHNNNGSNSNEEDDSNRKISRVELVSRSSLPVNESGGGKSFLMNEQQQNSEATTVSSSSAPRLTFFQRVVNFIDESSLLKENHNSKGSSSSSKRMLFDKNRYVIRMISYLLILVAYGAIFPPLAIIVFLSVILRTVYEEILMGRLLFTFPQRTERRLQNDCQGMMTPMKYCLAIIIPISTLLYSYLIFDSFGKEEEEGIAIIPGIIFGVYSTVLVVWLNTMNTRTKKRKDQKKERNDNSGGKDQNETNNAKSDMNDGSSVENPMY